MSGAHDSAHGKPEELPLQSTFEIPVYQPVQPARSKEGGSNLGMLQQIRRLSRSVPALGRGVTAIAVYAHPTDEGMELRAAAETGFEGVACVDDAARLAGLYIAIWRKGKEDWARTAALEALAFVRAMQTSEGWFVNFIVDWDGTKNLAGRTSGEPQGPWLARACHALAAGAAAFSDGPAEEAFARALPWLKQPTPHLDVRAVALLAALEHPRGGHLPDLDHLVWTWGTELFESRTAGVLPDLRGSREVHLWGHLQECALAEAGRRTNRYEWVDAARASADRLLMPAAERAFPGTSSNPFDVSSVVRGLDAVGAATRDRRYRIAANVARSWFDGRNAASTPVFDRRQGLVHDGVDGFRVSANSGAEANIEGALALMNP